jgi:aspartate/methionine/tyrosine aminotransferase
VLSKRDPKMTGLTSSYLDWYVHVPSLKYDLRSSGITNFRWKLNLGEVNLTENYVHGNPKALKLLADRYGVKPENVFISGDGASGQNTRVMQCLSSRMDKQEAVVEYPTYEPMLRQAQTYFKKVKRVERKKESCYRFDPDKLEQVISDRTAVLVMTNPHAPSGVSLSRKDLIEIMDIARSHDCFVVCDEIYAEFDRENNAPLFSIDQEFGIVTTSFSKAYGLGGLKAGIIVASKEIVDELYSNVFNSAGSDSNLVELALIDLLTKGRNALESHKDKWLVLRSKTEKYLKQTDLFSYTPNSCGVVFWLETHIRDTYKWVNQYAIPRFSLAVVPGAFFLLRKYRINKTNQVRLGIGNLNPKEPDSLKKALQNLEKALLEGKKLGF